MSNPMPNKQLKYVPKGKLENLDDIIETFNLIAKYRRTPSSMKTACSLIRKAYSKEIYAVQWAKYKDYPMFNTLPEYQDKLHLNLSRPDYAKLLRTFTDLSIDALINSYIRMSPDDTTAIKVDYLEKVKRGTSTQRHSIVNWQGYLDAVARILDNDNVGINPTILAICAATGRRMSEVALQCDFNPILIDDKLDHTRVIFTGQLKTKDIDGASKSYEIPTLVDSRLVFKAIARVPYNRINPQSYNNSNAKTLGKLTRTLFAEYFRMGYDRDIIKNLLSKDLRAIYATLAWNLINRRQSSFNTYAAEILGHSELDMDTANSYAVFSMSDDTLPLNRAIPSEYMPSLQQS